MNDYEVPSFLKKDGSAILYNSSGEFFFYVPEEYFEKGYAVFVGDIISIFGILDYSINNKENDSSYYGKNLTCFNFPTVFLTKPYTVISVKGLNLGKGKPKDYRIMKYKKDDQVVVSTHVPEILDNVEDLYRLFIITGKIPANIEYGTIWEYFPYSMELNGGSYNVINQDFALIESELCRDPDDLSKPFRLSSKRKDKKAFTTLSIKDLPKHISAYTALTSENWDDSIVAATLNKKEVYTPLEKVLMQ